MTIQQHVVVNGNDMKVNNRTKKLGIILAAFHVIAFFATIIYTVNSAIEQASLIWLLWFPVDFPWSLINILGGESYSIWVDNISNKSILLGYLFYTPYLVHGFVGAIWWYFLPTIISMVRRRKSRAKAT